MLSEKNHNIAPLLHTIDFFLAPFYSSWAVDSNDIMLDKMADFYEC